MARVKIELPQAFHFTASIPVRITDVNYGGHVGNDSILSLIHEARMQFLSSHGLSELDFAGVGLIMSDVVIEFKNEAFYGDVLKADVTTGDASRISFDVFYKFSKEKQGKEVLVALAKTGMVCYDYKNKKIVAIPEEARESLRL